MSENCACQCLRDEDGCTSKGGFIFTLEPALALATTFRHTPSSYPGQAVSPMRNERELEEFKDLLIPPRVPERIRFPRASSGGTKTNVIVCGSHNEGGTTNGTLRQAGIMKAAVAPVGAVRVGRPSRS